MRKTCVLITLLLLVSGCMVGPNYQRPQVEIPDAWRFDAGTGKDALEAKWWMQFNDPVLNDLIDTALKGNKDLLIAAERIEDYMGRYMNTRGQQYPQISFSANAQRQRYTMESTSPTLEGAQNTFNTFQTLLNASWEIDLWGKLRRSTEAARADLLSTEEAKKGVILSLVTTVVNAYLDLRDYDLQLEIARETAKTRENSYNIFTMKFEGGIISEVELSQSKSEYEEALASIPLIEKNVYQTEDQICFLLGKNPGPVPRGKRIQDLTPPVIPAGLPSEVLAQRPDILQAEQDLIAANARIGVARAAYYPSISLTGFFGYSSTDLSNLFIGPARTWNWATPVTAPIFKGGSIEGQVVSAEAQQRQAILNYQKTIQTAFKEVNDALIERTKTKERVEAQGRQVDALKNYARLARLRYDNGYTSYLEVLDAERSLFNVELGYVQTQGSLLKTYVNIYKAMGGAWVIEADTFTKKRQDAIREQELSKKAQ